MVLVESLTGGCPVLACEGSLLEWDGTTRIDYYLTHKKHCDAVAVKTLDCTCIYILLLIARVFW
jgi:hypothetical protein